MRYTLSLKLTGEQAPFFGPGPARLLELVGGGRSLHQAAAELGMAYSKAWRILRDAEEALGFPLLRRQRGGAGGGGSTLTDEARDLLRRYRRFQTQLYTLGDRLFDECFGDLP